MSTTSSGAWPKPGGIKSGGITQPVTTGSVMKKVSRHLLWFLFVLFFFSFLDRINIGFAGLTMLQDLELTGMQFGFATTLFYLAYIAFGIPANLILMRVGARLWIGSIMIAWGLASSATMFATGPLSLYVLRTLVGITEAGFLPGILLYLTVWFPSAYRARANSMFMIAMPVTAAVGSAISGYILALDGTWGLRGWQWLFLLEGMPTVALGFMVYYRLHDSPLRAKWLTADEQQVLAQTLAAEHRAADKRGEDVSLWRELLSPTVIRFSLTYFCLVNTLAMVAVWAPMIVKSISADASNRTVGLLATIPQIVTIVAMIVWGRRSDRHQERKWHLVVPMAVSAIGWFMTAYIEDPFVKMGGVCLASAGSYTAMSIFWTTPDHALSRRARAVGLAVINALGNISSALNPLVVGWLKDLTHSFSAGVVYSAVLLIIGVLIAMTLPIARNARASTRPEKEAALSA